MRPWLALLATALPLVPARAEAPCEPVKPCEAPAGSVPQVVEPPAELGAEAKALFALVTCPGSASAAPAGLDGGAVRAFCGRRAQREARAQAARAAAVAALPAARPERPPSVVIYPLGGGDLLAARAAFPGARNYTLTGPIPAGDPRLAGLRERSRLEAFLQDASLPGAPRTALPALLAALAAEGAEPVGLRYLRVEPGGALHFYGPAELAAQGDRAWASCELLFVTKAQPDRQLVVRYLQADLADGGPPGPLAHLAAKGTFAAMLPAGGAVAGAEYGHLRAILEQRAALVVTRTR
jgi:hypothetical protein